MSRGLDIFFNPDTWRMKEIIILYYNIPHQSVIIIIIIIITIIMMWHFRVQTISFHYDNYLSIRRNAIAWLQLSSWTLLEKKTSSESHYRCNLKQVRRRLLPIGAWRFNIGYTIVYNSGLQPFSLATHFFFCKQFFLESCHLG
jgi:hypothetical protein